MKATDGVECKKILTVGQDIKSQVEALFLKAIARVPPIKVRILTHHLVLSEVHEAN